MKDLFEGNKHGFDSESVSQNRREVSCWRLYTAILGVYMGRINHDSARVNISVFIEQRNISFQNDISLKNHEIGSLVVRPWEKLKNRETHGRIVRVGRSASYDIFYRNLYVVGRNFVLSGHYSILCGVRLHYTSFTVHVWLHSH